MKGKRLQCKDIPDRPILELLRDLPDWDTVIIGRPGRQRNGCPWPGFDNSMTPAFPQGDETPQKLVLAKMRRLIQHKLVDGCPCGCRGDFQLLDKGRQIVGTRENPK